MRCIASALFLVAHGLLVLEHITIGTALHGIAELFLAPWAIRHKAWDIIVIGLIFCVFDLWGTLRLDRRVGLRPFNHSAAGTKNQTAATTTRGTSPGRPSSAKPDVGRFQTSLRTAKGDT